jgi:DNA-binding transcriptional ArsR family regulator
LRRGRVVQPSGELVVQANVQSRDVLDDRLLPPRRDDRYERGRSGAVQEPRDRNLRRRRTDRDARVIRHAVQDDAGAGADLEERVVRLGKALGDPARVRIVRRLSRGEASLGELAQVAGLAKSTAHHHLAALRAAGLVVMRGNARGYWYTLRLESLADARALLTDLVER